MSPRVGRETPVPSAFIAPRHIALSGKRHHRITRCERFVRHGLRMLGHDATYLKAEGVHGQAVHRAFPFRRRR